MHASKEVTNAIPIPTKSADEILIPLVANPSSEVPRMSNLEESFQCRATIHALRLASSLTAFGDFIRLVIVGRQIDLVFIDQMVTHKSGNL